MLDRKCFDSAAYPISADFNDFDGWASVGNFMKPGI